MKRVVLVNRHTYRLHIFEQDDDSKFQKVHTFPIAIGAIGYRTPAGVFKVQRKSLNPDWLAPNSEWVPEEIRGKVFLGGTDENPIKAAFIDIWNGVGIHGTSDLASLGTQASHGCIRMDPDDVLTVYKLVRKGTIVFIT